MTGIIIGFMWGVGFGAFMGAAIHSWMVSVGQNEEDEEEAPKPKAKRCVMCKGTLKPMDESRHWKGAHEWCETYY